MTPPSDSVRHRQVCIPVADSSRVGEARRAAVQAAEAAGLGEDDVGRVGVVVTEVASNLHRHAVGGEVLLRTLCDPPGLEILATDRGPGMADVGRCLADGYSTGGTAGIGLGAVARMSSVFDIYSLTAAAAAKGTQGPAGAPGNAGPAVGTVLLARIRSGRTAGGPGDPGGPKAGADWQVGVVCRPAPGEIECGDGWAADSAADGRVRLAMADGLGHGLAAAEAARACLRSFRDLPGGPPLDVLRAAHAAARVTRGAAMAVAEIDPTAGMLRFAGIGNIAGSVSGGTGPGAAGRGLVSLPGILGQEARRFTDFTIPWGPGSLLVMHSDGLGSRWDLARYPGLTVRHPALIAAVLYRDYSRGRDDVTVAVMRAA